MLVATSRLVTRVLPGRLDMLTSILIPQPAKYSFYTVKRSILELFNGSPFTVLVARCKTFFFGGPFLPSNLCWKLESYRKKSIRADWSGSITSPLQRAQLKFWGDMWGLNAVRQAAWDGKWGHETKLWPAGGLAISSPQRWETNQVQQQNSQNRRKVLASRSNSFKCNVRRRSQST